jgi:hypothetical protein
MQKSQKKKASKKGKEGIERLLLSANVSAGRLNQYKGDPFVSFAYPLSRYDFSKIHLAEGKDTSRPEVSFIDSVKRKIEVKHKWKEGKNYTLIIPDSVFFSINEFANDSLVSKFKTMVPQDFGSLRVTISFTEGLGNYIIQLLNEKETVMEEKIISKPEIVEFDYITPGNYKIKAILDHNRDSRWNTGNYLKYIQPEEVFYFPKLIEVRGNWDIDESWSL